MKYAETGASAEYLLASELLARGAVPCWPSTESRPYDMIAETPQGLCRIQVKSTNTPGPTFRLNIRGKVRNRARAYSIEDVDVVAVYLFQAKAWYFIPTDKTETDIRIRFNTATCKWSRYLNKWSVLGL